MFPLLTSLLWHVHTWFSLECRFCGIADGKPASGFIWGEGGSNVYTTDFLKGYSVCVLKFIVMSAVKNTELQAQNQRLHAGLQPGNQCLGIQVET